MNTDEKLAYHNLYLLFLPYKHKVICVLGCLALYTCLNLLIPILTKAIIDKGIVEKNYIVVLSLSLIIILVALFNAALDIFKEKKRTELVYEINSILYTKAFDDILNVKMQYFEDKNTTEIFNNLRFDIEKIEETCSQHIFSSVVIFFGFIGGFVGITLIEWKIAFLVLCFIPIKAIIIKYLSKIKKKISKDIVEINSTFGHWFGDTLGGVKEIKMFGIQNNKKQELSINIHKLQSLVKKNSILDSLNISSEICFLRLLEGVVTIAGARLILRDELSLGSLFAILAFSVQVISPVSIILNIQYHLSSILPSVQRYFSFLDEIRTKKEPSCGVSASQVENIRFEKVMFAYSDKPLLHNISFTINSGEKIGLVGRNGAGKTTIFKLITRLIEPSDGKIYVNGTDLAAYDLESWRAQLGIIDQDNFLFNLSILDSIKMYSDLNQEEVMKAIRQCDLEILLDTATKIGHNGCNLSGGQRQKLLFARLLIRKKSLYLLDEATANLDSVSENIILNILDTSLKDRTVLMITHNMNLLSKMDKVIHLCHDDEAIIYATPQDFIKSQGASTVLER